MCICIHIYIRKYVLPVGDPRAGRGAACMWNRNLKKKSSTPPLVCLLLTDIRFVDPHASSLNVDDISISRHTAK